MDYLREGIHLRGFGADRTAGGLQERGLHVVRRTDEQRLDRLRADDLNVQVNVEGENGGGPGGQPPSFAAAGTRRERGGSPTPAATARRARGARRRAAAAGAAGARATGTANSSKRCRSSSSASSTRAPGRPATTPAGAAAARIQEVPRRVGRAGTLRERARGQPHSRMGPSPPSEATPCDRRCVCDMRAGRHA